MKFKTKKDKIIEEQKARIESLEQKIFYSSFKRPTIIEQQREIITVGCNTLLEDGMSVEYAKEIIARKMVDEFKEYIEYDMKDGPGKGGRPYPIITGYLRIAITKWGE